MPRIAYGLAILLALSPIFFIVGSRPANASGFKHYLIIPYIGLTKHEQKLFDRHLKSWLARKGHRLINTGTRKYPWYCVEYRWPGYARSVKAKMAQTDWARSIARKSMISTVCAAG